MRFSEYEKEYIINNYRTMKTKEIAKNLNMEYKRVKAFADNNKLQKGCKHVFFSVEEENYIDKWYGIKSSYEIADDLNSTIKDVNFYANYKGLVFNSNKYNINQNYFETVNTPNKAYWLGFLYADGCILVREKNGRKSYVLEVALNIDDLSHLEKFKMCLKSNSPIKEKTIQDKYKACRLTICNKKICEDLIKLGCTPRKSLTLTFPTEEQVSKELIPHFIRGYVDGDGCIYKSCEKSSVSIVGTENFLKSIQDIVYDELGLTRVSLQNSKGKAWQCQWGGVGNLKTWFDYLYSYDDIIYLHRKFEKFFA